jgi:hypothetical protein
MKRAIHLGMCCGILLLVGGAVLFVLDMHRYTTLLDWLGWPLLWLIGSVLVLASTMYSMVTPGRLPTSARQSPAENEGKAVEDGRKAA